MAYELAQQGWKACVLMLSLGWVMLAYAINEIALNYAYCNSPKQQAYFKQITSHHDKAGRCELRNH